MIIYQKEGIITRSDDKTNIKHFFDVPEGTEKIIIRYSYNPKTVEDEKLADALLLEGMERYGALELDKNSLLPVKNLITLSFDECGKYRGACHRQSNDQTVIISDSQSTPGVINRKIESGKWDIVLNVHYAGCKINYKLEIDAEGVTR